MWGEDSSLRIEEYGFGRIKIDGVMYNTDVVVLPDRVVTDWWRKEGHLLLPEDIETHIGEGVRCLIVGTGAYGCMKVDGRTEERLKEQGVELVVMRTADAVAEFNRRGGAGIVCALHLTC